MICVFIDENIHIMRDDANYWNSLRYYLETTEILTKLSKSISQTQKDDSLMFYMSGHGVEVGERFFRPTDILLGKFYSYWLLKNSSLKGI